LYNLGAGFYSRPDTAQLSRGTYRGVRGDFTGDAQPDVLWYGVGPARESCGCTGAGSVTTSTIVTSTVPRRSDGTNRLLLDLGRPPSSGRVRTGRSSSSTVGLGQRAGGQRQVPTMSADPRCSGPATPTRASTIAASRTGVRPWPSAPAAPPRHSSTWSRTSSTRWRGCGPTAPATSWRPTDRGVGLLGRRSSGRAPG
jgi:hypothetical protein